MKKIVNQSGQIVVIALLAMVVVLAIALAIIGRSMLEISTSARTEESSRAFSAAEAGIERGLQDKNFGGGGSSGNLLSFDNNAEATVDVNANLPDAGLPLEHPPIGKESFAQFWLANPYGNLSASDPFDYPGSKFKIYFGAVKNSSGKTIDYAADVENKPALEVMVVYLTGGEYKSTRYLYDSNNSRGNSFRGCDIGQNQRVQTNQIGHYNDFYCSATVPGDGSNLPVGVKIMVRVRILYSSFSHPIAVGPFDGPSGNIPKQATITKSTGTVGNVQRSIEVFKQQSVLPQFLDYALFSASSIDRQGGN